jgi:hypothetical protein
LLLLQKVERHRFGIDKVAIDELLMLPPDLVHLPFHALYLLLPHPKHSPKLFG